MTMDVKAKHTLQKTFLNRCVHMQSNQKRQYGAKPDVGRKDWIKIIHAHKIEVTREEFTNIYCVSS